MPLNGQTIIRFIGTLAIFAIIGVIENSWAQTPTIVDAILSVDVLVSKRFM